MKKLAVVVVAITLGLTTAVKATNPPAPAAKLPADFKQEIADHLTYPDFATENLIEGEVWMKVTVDEKSTVKIVELSATQPELGTYVKEELSDLTIKDKSFEVGSVYFMKVKFDLANM